MRFYDPAPRRRADATFIPGNYSLRAEMSAVGIRRAAEPREQDHEFAPDHRGHGAAGCARDHRRDHRHLHRRTQRGGGQRHGLRPPSHRGEPRGWLFPATYQLDGSETAQSILQMLVDEMISRLDAAGVAPEQRHEVLTKAALVQREAGSNPDDFYKVARVFQNRIDEGLEPRVRRHRRVRHREPAHGMDDRRGAGGSPRTSTTPTRTRVCPIGPIGAPGDLAIDAVLHPAGRALVLLRADQPRNRGDGVLGDRRRARGRGRAAARLVRRERWRTLRTGEVSLNDGGRTRLSQSWAAPSPTRNPRPSSAQLSECSASIGSTVSPM